RSFFFSSRRRHTRFSRDWSSDVCSSDLGQQNESENFSKRVLGDLQTQETSQQSRSESDNKNHVIRSQMRFRPDSLSNLNIQLNGSKGQREIGRASCRKRVYKSVVVVL